VQNLANDEAFGVKGDAFRIVLLIPEEMLKKAKKLEARLAKPPEAKE
jgi:hypothetical protein